MLSIINNNQDLTMSSREIAELTGKNHSHVKRDIAQTILQLNYPDKKLKDCPIFNPPELEGHGIDIGSFVYAGNTYDEFHLNHEYTTLLVSGYSAALRLKIIKRWNELESTPKEDPIVLLAQKVLQQDAEIKHLEKTKAHINDKRTATVMGKLGAATKKIKSLESKFQDVGTRLSLKGAKLPERIDTEFKSDVQTWRVLKQLSLDMNQSIEKVEDSNYGSVNTYHIDVIEAFKTEYL